MVLHDISNYVKDKEALEIGGPSILFNFLYPLLKSLDILNHPDAASVHSNCGTVNQNTVRYEGDATISEHLLKIDKKYNLIITSHTLEHIANPIKAVELWVKLLKPNGLIIQVLPNKNECWDRGREFVKLDHLIDDYNNDIGEDDMTHIHEASCIMENRPDYYKEVGDENKYRIIHHHCFDIQSLTGAHEYKNMFKTQECYIATNDPLQLVYIGKLIG